MEDFTDLNVTEESDLLLNESEDQCSENTKSESLQQPSNTEFTAHSAGRRVKLCVQNSWIVKELIKQIRLAVPVILTMLLSQLVFFISNVFVGHLSDDPIDLDVSGLGFTFVNMIGVSVGVGLSTAADTLFAQTYGFKNYKRVGIILQRAILILLLTAFPVIVLCQTSEFFLLLIQQKPCVARLTSDYIKIFSVGIPIIYILTLLQLYLQAQSIVAIFMVVGVLLNIASVLAHSLFLYLLDWGVLGASAAIVVAHLLALIFLLFYIRIRGLHRKTWYGWSWSSLREWWPFLRLGLPGMLMICLEWWAFEIGTVIAGILGRIPLAVNSVLFNSLAAVYMLALGVGVAGTVRVGNELGAGNPIAAKRAAYTSVILGCVASASGGIIFIAFRHEIGKIFTSDQEVIDGVAEVCYIAGPMLFFDLVMVTSSGVLKGLGKQFVGAVTNFITYYIIGVPLIVYLALYGGLGVIGIWIGLAVADFIQMTVFLLVIFCTNWKKQSLKAVSNAKDKGDLTHMEPVTSLELQSLAGHNDEENNSDHYVDKHEQSQVCIVDQQISDSSQLTKSTAIVEESASTGSRESIDLTNGSHEEVENASTLNQTANTNANQTHDTVRETLNVQKKLWLLTSKGVWFLVGSVFVIAAGIVGNFQSDAISVDNCTNITTGNE